MEETRGFKRKTIERNISSKMDEWIKTLPEDLRESVKADYIVTGGAIASMLLGQLPKDYDVYFKTPEIAKKVAEYYINGLAKDEHASEIGAIIEGNRVRVCIKSAGIALGDQKDFEDYQYFESLPPEEAEKYFNKYATYIKDDKSYKPALITSNAVSLHGHVQLILRFIGAPEEIHKNYDFVHCTNWYTDLGGLVLQQPALESILSKELKYVGSLYPVCSMFRIKKFIRRGWSITAGEILKICWDISKLDLDDRLVLQEQLIGVDQAYFNQVISLLKEKENIDRTYLFEVINRVFDQDEFDIGFNQDRD
jgi:hypothetical protein